VKAALTHRTLFGAAREITKRRKERIDLQEKGYAAEGLKVLKEAARKAKESEMLAKKPKLSAEERLSRIEERPVAPLPAGKAELKKLEIEQLANRVENKASAADEITLALGDGELVSGPLEKALQMDAGTAEVLNAKESDEALAMLALAGKAANASPAAASSPAAAAPPAADVAIDVPPPPPTDPDSDLRT
jgi:hypothetical protein